MKNEQIASSSYTADNQKMASATDSSGIRTDYTYGNDHRLQSRQTGTLDSTGYTYDSLGRVKTESWDDGTTLHYKYSSEGALSEQYVTDAAGRESEHYYYTYDSLGRLIRSKETGTPGSGNGSTSLVQRTEHIYDSADRLTRQSWQLGNRAYTENYTYDSNGNIGSEDISSEDPDLPGGSHSYSYDNPSWLDLLTAFDGEAIAYEGQTYDPVSGTVSGNVISGNPYYESSLSYIR